MDYRNSKGEKMPRWSRAEKLSTFQEFLINKICKNTPGMTRYGNRVRISVMLPVELAEKIAETSRLENKTVSEIVVSALKQRK